MAHDQSYDHLITRAILSHHLATLAFIVQQSHINAKPIARFNAFASQNGRFRSCDRCVTTFSYAIISATVYDPNLNFSIARLFGRFWSCANCERAFRACLHDLQLHVGSSIFQTPHLPYTLASGILTFILIKERSYLYREDFTLTEMTSNFVW